MTLPLGRAVAGLPLPRLGASDAGAGDACAAGMQATELPGDAEAQGPAELLGAAEPPEAAGDAELGAAEPLGKLGAGLLSVGELLGTAELPGAVDAQAAIGLADGATEADGVIVGDGFGRSPTGSGPTKTRAARMPPATRTPTRRPAMMVIPVFIAAEGTSTDGRGRSDHERC